MGRTELRAREPLVWIALACGVASFAPFACNDAPDDFHASQEVKGQACVSCHAGAYNAAVNPVHVNRMPQTCQDCHHTKAWSPSSVTDHRWWPIQNKHVGVSCAACHSKGFQAGDTPSACEGCHMKEYEAALNPKHRDALPSTCATCHADTGFKPSTFRHDAWPLEGRHAIGVTPCAGCHTGNPPTYKGTPKECYACHKDEADTRARTKNPDHATFPPTCRNCHLMSGWTQGPPLTGLHPEAAFPIQTGVHADGRIACLDCHQLEKGPAAGGANTDCVHCHMGSHVTPAIDAYHQRTPSGRTVAGYPQASPTTNFCLQCHDKGQHL